ncbi:MAG TPA: ribonuclease HII [Patescibacteria group bacterium]
MVLPDFKYEKSLWKKGYRVVAGCDEVGRGCFAGPVVSSCVVFQKDLIIPSDILINDSKKLKPNQREKASIWIKKNCLTWGIGEASVSVINKLGIVPSTYMAFRKAIISANKKINSPIDYLLIDAFYLPYIKGLKRKNQMPLIKGDAKSISIAASSIIAKVHRDKIMLTLSKNPKYQNYGWGRNKGYGTREHQNAIKEFGTTNLHRSLFVETFLSK